MKRKVFSGILDIESKKVVSIVEEEKEKRYVSDNAQLMEEWNWEKNITLGYFPNKLSYGSAQKVWWKCAEGHEWEASPNNRSRTQKCPVCSKQIQAESHSKNWIIKRGSLADLNPVLASQWHPTQNGMLTANDVSAGSGRKVWWLCEQGHEWEAVISSRNGGINCPICSGRKVLVGYNDLATVRPDLARQWHPTKNDNLKPTDVTVGSDQKIWWICEKNHEWESRVAHRKNGCNCPICSGKKVLFGYNDLATVAPDIATQWHPTKNGDLTPQKVVANSNKRVWWQCAKGHEWQTSVATRKRGCGCPQCASESKTSFPEQAIYYYLRNVTTAHNRYLLDSRTEIDIYLPEYRIGIEYDGIYYHSSEKAKVREQQKQEKLSRQGIRLLRIKESLELSTSAFCEDNLYIQPGPTQDALTQVIRILVSEIGKISNRILTVDIDVMRDRHNIYDQYVASEKANSLLVVNPQLAAQWHPTMNKSMLPEYVSASSNKKVWWLCDGGHEWEAMVNTRNKGVGCPYCAGKRAIIGQTDLATVRPLLAAQWHPTKNKSLTPMDVTASSNKKVWWQCDSGHEWRTMVYDRTNGGNCPICSGRQVLVGFNDLATKNPALAAQWHPNKNNQLQPTDVTCGSDKKVWWRCDSGHEWEAVISSRNSGINCPYCSNQKLLVGFNDLATTNPILAAQWHPTKNGELTPSDVMAGTNKKVWWLGDCGHEWNAVISSRNTGRGCVFCANQRVLAGFNDLITLNPTLAAEWHPTKNGELTPADVTAGANRKVWWLGACGHEWQNTVNSRNSGHGCPICDGQYTMAGHNDLATIYPELAEQWHPTKNGDWRPCDVRPSSNKKAWWLCEKGHEWEAVIGSRSKGVGCPICANKKTLAGYNDLATTNPALAAQWHPTKNVDLYPTDVTRSSNKKVWWLCSNGHEWQATVNHRNAGRRCPQCVRRKQEP